MKKEDLTDETGLKSLDPKHAPIPMPAGSFDMAKLVAAAEEAHNADDRDTAVSEAIEHAAAEGTLLKPADPREQDGMTFVDVKREDLGIVENFQVATPAAESDDDAAPVEPSGTRTKATVSKRSRRKPPAAKLGATDQTNNSGSADAGAGDKE